jgi:hypothetical protein
VIVKHLLWTVMERSIDRGADPLLVVLLGAVSLYVVLPAATSPSTAVTAARATLGHGACCR